MTGHGKAMVGLVALAGLATALIFICEPAHVPPWDRLEDAWRTHHPGAELPAACETDQFQDLTGDMDPTPGEELLVASDRLGIALFDEDNDLLAYREPVGCRGDSWSVGDMSRVLDSTVTGLVTIESHRAGCRRFDWATLLRREGEALVAQASYRYYDYDGCNGKDITRWTRAAELIPGGVIVRVDVYDQPTRECKVVGDTTSPDCAFLVEK